MGLSFFFCGSNLGCGHKILIGEFQTKLLCIEHLNETSFCSECTSGGARRKSDRAYKPFEKLYFLQQTEDLM